MKKSRENNPEIQEELCHDAKNQFGQRFWCKPGCEWDEESSAIFWTGESSYIQVGPEDSDIEEAYNMDRYLETDGVHPKLEAWAQENKIYLEPYDGGTLLGYEA